MGQFNTKVLIFLDTDGQAFELGPPSAGRPLAEVDNMRLAGYEGIPSKLLISLTADADSVTGTTNRAASQRGAAGCCSQRLCWAGEAPAGWVQSRLYREERRFDWCLSFHPAHIEEVRVSARVDPIERLPESLESAFGVP